MTDAVDERIPEGLAHAGREPEDFEVVAGALVALHGDDDDPAPARDRLRRLPALTARGPARHTGTMADTDPQIPTFERPSDEELRQRLTPEQYEVTQHAGTEAAFTGVYWDEKRSGTYRCVVCGLELFESDTKYESGSGWPSFWKPIADDRVTLKEDRSHGMVRTEVTCARCDAHLGHVFPDGPRPTGQRYCMNSASLDLDSAE